MINKTIIKEFLDLDNTKNYSIEKYFSSFDNFLFKKIIKKDKISKNEFLDYFISLQFKELKTYQIKYFWWFYKIWFKSINKKIERNIFNIIKSKYLNSTTSKSDLKILKNKLNEFIFDNLRFIHEINDLFLYFVVKNKKLNKYLTKLKEIITLLKNEEIENDKRSKLIDQIADINCKHQKLFSSYKYDNVIVYYQQKILNLDSFINDDNNIFKLSDVNYGFLNSYIKFIKYNFKFKSNIYKSQIFETFMVLSNISRIMNQYGFKTTYIEDRDITIENTQYILEEFK